MSFAARDLSVLAYANGFTAWHYRSEDRLADLLAEGYFDSAQEIFRAGDLLICSLLADKACDTHLLAVRKLDPADRPIVRMGPLTLPSPPLRGGEGG